MSQVQHSLLATACAALLLPVTACNSKNPFGSASTSDVDNVKGQVKAPVDVGAPLYKAEPLPKLTENMSSAEPVVIPNATVQNDVRVQISATVDGKIETIASELPPNVPFDAKNPLHIFHPRDLEKKRPYRKLREGDFVRAGEIICRQDEQLIQLQVTQFNDTLPLMKKQLLASEQGVNDQKDALLLTEKVPAIARLEILNQKSTLNRFYENLAQNQREYAKMESEFRSAYAQLDRFFIRSPINGRIIKLLKSPGEFAKAGDQIMEIQATERVRVEGKLDAAYRNKVREGMMVQIEPVRPVGPHPFANYHRQEVTSIAITAHPGRPLIVSGGLDATALVWDPLNSRSVSHRLPHSVGVRVVATTGKMSKRHLVATGCEDGKVRIWDISNPDKLPKEPLITFDETHTSFVSAASFSPDGRYLATASGRDVYVWDIDNKTRKFSLPADHKDAITMVRFTPQATLVTASRDRSIRNWKLGTSGAATQQVIDHRGGTVEMIGMTSDGGRIIFDKDSSRLDLVSLADERTVGTLQTGSSDTRFATLALFSNDDNFILTAGGESEQKGELRLWVTPQPGSRGSERLRLKTPGSATVTCAAFSPDADKRFVAVGTVEGGVHFWTPDLVEQRNKNLMGEVVSVVSADARQVTVRVELANPESQGDSLQDRSMAAIIVPADASSQTAIPVNNPGQSQVRPAGGTIDSSASVLIPTGGTTLPPAEPATNPIIPAAAIVPSNVGLPPSNGSGQPSLPPATTPNPKDKN